MVFNDRRPRKKKTEVKNLLPWPYNVAVGETVVEGTTYTIYPDGRIHVRGTPTSYNDLGIIRGDAGAKLAKAIEGKTISIGFLNGKTAISKYVFYFAITKKADGKHVVLVNHYDTDSVAMVKENIDLSQYGELESAYITIKRSSDVNFNLMLYPMINEGPKALPFVPPIGAKPIPMPITFTVGKTTYEAEMGMTWYEWVHSIYCNDKNFSCDSNSSNVFYYDEAYLGSLFIEDGSGRNMIGEDILEDGGTYRLFG